MRSVEVFCIVMSTLIENWKIAHEKVDFYVTVRPEGKDPKGFLGYKWRGLVYEKLNEYNQFVPIESCELFLSPKQAIRETTMHYLQSQGIA